MKVEVLVVMDVVRYRMMHSSILDIRRRVTDSVISPKVLANARRLNSQFR